MQPLTARRSRIVVVLFLLAVVVIGWWMFSPSERVYQGRPVSAWVRQLSITQIGQTNDILDTLLDVGPDCLPTLGAELGVRDSFLNEVWQELWPELPRGLRRSLPKPLSCVERRATAAWALGQIGPAARPAVPALVKALDDPDDRVRAEAALALRFIGSKKPEAIAALARRLSDKSPWVQSQAAWALWDMAPESRAALPELIQLLGVPDRSYNGVLCLQELGPLASNAVPALIEVVKRGAAGHPPDWKFPVVAGADGKPDGKDHSAHNRAMAAKALGRIGIASPEVVKTLQEALKYPPTLEGCRNFRGPGFVKTLRRRSAFSARTPSRQSRR